MIKVVLFDVGQVLVKFSGPQLKLFLFARRLRKRRLKTAILSNVDMPVGMLVKYSQILRGFKPVILSFEEGVDKPDPKIYKITLKKLGVKPSEVVFIDNRTENILEAQHQGMHIIHAVSTKQIIADIKILLKDQNKLDI